MKNKDTSLRLFIVTAFAIVLTAMSIIFLLPEYNTMEDKLSNEEFVELLESDAGFMNGLNEQAESYELVINLSGTEESLLAVVPQIENISKDYYELVKDIKDENSDVLTDEQNEFLDSIANSAEELSESMALLHKGLSINDSGLVYEAGEKFGDSKVHLEKVLNFLEDGL